MTRESTLAPGDPLDYATTRTPAPPPRPTAALWAAAALVWAATLPAALYFAARAIGAILAGDARGDLAFAALFLGGAAAIEWFAVVGREPLCAMLVGIVAAAIGGFAALASLVWLYPAVARHNLLDTLTTAAPARLIGIALAFGFVAFVHARWERNLRAHARQQECVSPRGRDRGREAA